MQLDIKLLRKMLLGFEAAPGASTNVNEVGAITGIDFRDDAVVHHLQILADHGYITPTKPDGSIGIRYGRGEILLSVVSLRLTAHGHEFLETIKNETVWKSITTTLADAGIATIKAAAPALLQAAVKAQIGG